MVVGVKVCEPPDGFLWFVCGLYVGILTSPLRTRVSYLFMFSFSFFSDFFFQISDIQRRIFIYKEDIFSVLPNGQYCLKVVPCKWPFLRINRGHEARRHAAGISKRYREHYNLLK